MQTKALKATIATLLINPSSGKAIAKVGFGEGGNIPTPDDTSLTNPYIKRLNSSRVVDNSSVEFSYSLGYNEANGKTIREIGLFTEDGTLVAREVKDVIEKDADTSYDGTITILL
jgi:hypothetical protein